MSVSSRSLASLTRSRAECSSDGSMRMSRGASDAYGNPRSGRSICMLETPRSKKIASACTPLSARRSKTSPKSPRRNLVGTPARRRNDSKYGLTLGSRSTPMNLPSPFRSWASSAACPPAPNVASMTVSPGCTSRSRRTSSARTGTWSVALGCKTLGNMLGTPFHLVELPPPALAIPDLEVVVHTSDDDVPLEAGVPEQRRGDHDPPLLVHLGLRRAREEVTLELASFPAERVELTDAGLKAFHPVGPRIGVETAVHASRNDDAFGQVLSKPGREREPVLVVECVFEFAEEHGRVIGLPPLRPTVNHDSPLCKRNTIMKCSSLLT